MNGLWINPLKSAHQLFWEEGLLFFPQVFEGEELQCLRQACETTLQRYLTDLDASDPGNKNSVVMRHLNDPRWHPTETTDWKVLMEAVADPRCLGPVEQIFRGSSLFRCTSLFFNPRFQSHEGNWHRDSQFIYQDEDLVKANATQRNLVGIQFQIALIDNDDLEYVPFSPSRYDSPEEYHIRCADDHKHSQEAGMPNAVRIPLRAGDAAIFNPNGLHRGRYYVDNPRRTLMLTYTPRDMPMCDYFSHQPWMVNEAYLSCLSRRARVYFDDFIQVYAESWKAAEDD
jgi:ectoine hydroxylase-related dioxygenase (phytanoyl-CoA dioxygenase family)